MSFSVSLDRKGNKLIGKSSWVAFVRFGEYDCNSISPLGWGMFDGWEAGFEICFVVFGKYLFYV